MKSRSVALNGRARDLRNPNLNLRKPTKGVRKPVLNLRKPTKDVRKRILRLRNPTTGVRKANSNLRKCILHLRKHHLPLPQKNKATTTFAENGYFLSVIIDNLVAWISFERKHAHKSVLSRPYKPGKNNFHHGLNKNNSNEFIRTLATSKKRK